MRVALLVKAHVSHINDTWHTAESEEAVSLPAKVIVTGTPDYRRGFHLLGSLGD